MKVSPPPWKNPREFLCRAAPEEPVALFCPARLHETALRFRQGFPGLVTYAVKANPDPAVLGCLGAAGLSAFDVASPWEMRHLRAIVPDAVLHYNNPVRTAGEIAEAVRLGVASYALDCPGELARLAALVPARGTEVAVRFKLPLRGAAYDFGSKFGATPEQAAVLLREVARLGFAPALAFHPGTQCHDAGVWSGYVAAAAGIAREAGVEIARLNVGGGFASHRLEAQPPALEDVFGAIDSAVARGFGRARPALLCEPGRGLVGDAFSLLTRVRALRPDGAVFLNEGIYGGLSEHLVIGPIDRVVSCAPDGRRRRGRLRPRVVFGPTCDSLDRLPEPLLLPEDLAEGDYLLFHGLGAYSTVLATRFNGYGVQRSETVVSLEC